METLSNEVREISLHNNTAKERRQWDELAEFFAIIKTVEHLENARIRNSIEKDKYTSKCSDLIAQFKDAEYSLIAKGLIKDTLSFIAEYKMDVPHATERLVKYGVPATVLHHRFDERDAISRARQAAETTQCFITAMDALKLDQRDVDEIQPLIGDVVDRLNKCDGLSDDFSGVKKMSEWLITLNAMRASDTLDEEQVRQLLYDLDNSYSAFFRFLGDSKGN
mmetsp:Transcript_17199/g.25477  ORF Transcript_17199/g.25477 Transcript_17199/m.25477 type:complete len:222 (+) Transcript_17199:30-695(+)|eukprot:CAMPEP_0171462400 /NCGR_PEP_ID=MMETSP0945-20130129/6449_1 /TAXON_ID=109269 /ORGANISM="Vaucheria litorea, Strain CCMP2940" /LENGTH=221 /DNA_ID=CAMNT_0011988911 /DNA_START=6 /DNA_END=671 /DNA_ORIENTATION=-